MALASGHSQAREEVYWATQSDASLAVRIIDKFRDYERFLRDSGLLYLWKRCWLEYHRGVVDNRIQSIGDQAEYTRIKVNHFRNILWHIYTNTTSSPPSMQPRASNTDYKSRAQVQICKGLLDYYMVEKEIDGKIDAATESAIVCGEGFVAPTWDAMAGRIFAMRPKQIEADGSTSGGTPIYEGDIRVDVPRPWDVARDPSVECFDDQPWLIVRRFRNRYDLIAERPELRDKILSLPDRWSSGRGDAWNARGTFEILRRQNEQESDQVPVYTLYHMRTPAMPLGRVTTIIDEETVWSDQTIQDAGYGGDEPGQDDIPVYRISSGDIEGYPFGFSFSFDLMAPQEGVNLLHSTIMTNNAAFGVQCLQAPAGTSVNVQHLSNGMVLIERPPGPDNRIEPVQLTKTASETFTYLEDMKQEMQVISGVNSVERGQPDAQLKSGVALALVEAQAIQFQGRIQKSYARLRSRTGTGTVRLFKSKVTTPRLAAIAGKDSRSHLKELKGSDIEAIDNVIVEVGSPLLMTAAGRVNLADQLIQMGQIETPEQLITVVTTGQIEQLTRSRQGTFDLIQLENEMLMNGEVPDVQLMDKHHLHLVEHAVIMSDPEVRKDPRIFAAHQEHQRKHLDLLSMMPPQLAAILQIPVVQAPQLPAPDAKGKPGAGGQLVDAVNPATGDLAQVQAIGTPKNPLTGAAIQPGMAAA